MKICSFCASPFRHWPENGPRCRLSIAEPWLSKAFAIEQGLVAAIQKGRNRQ